MKNNLKYNLLKEKIFLDKNDILIKNLYANVTNDKLEKTNQNITLARINKDKNYIIANWVKFDENGNFILSDILECAKDFESKNPNYEIICGINGDYFNFVPEYPINAVKIFDNSLVKANNNYKYHSLIIDNYFKNFKIKDTIKLSKKYYLYSNNFLKKVNIKELLNQNNKIILNLGGDKKNSFYLEKFTDFEDSYFLKFSKTKSNKIIEILSDQKLSELFNKENNFTIQKKTYDNQILGFDSVILKKHIYTFDKIKGQGYEHATFRHPRTGIGFDKEKNLYLVTTDGRSELSNGVDLREFALIMKENNIILGMNLDGGGSTEFVIKENNKFKVINHQIEYDKEKNLYRRVSNCIFIVRKK